LQEATVKSSAASITSIFYLTLACLTLLAAARQWLPQEGFPPRLDLGAKQARAQSPAPLTPTAGVPNGGVFAPPSTGVTSPPGMASPGVAPQVATAVPPAAQFPAVITQPPLENPTFELDATRVVARVGGEVILAGDVLSSVNSTLARNGFDPKDPALAQQKEQYFQMRLKQIVETRVILCEAKRKIPAEGLKRAMTMFNDEFDKSVVPKMLEDRKIKDVAELEAQLRREGSTLERERDAFAEMVLCNSWLGQNTKVSEDVPHHEMLQYYQEHSAEYEFQAQARWEQLMISFSSQPTKAEAYAVLAQLGNEIVDGRAFAEAARAASQGSTASQGGVHPWTKKGSLVSKALDTAIFTLPVGTLSPIIEDERGFHIVRVIERREAGRTPFAETQSGIRKKIIAQRTEKAKKDFVEEIRLNTQVWTIYDKPQQPAVGTAAVPNLNPRR
jgi:parvulin-like peptidyl-prolyl isomerase